MDEKPHLMTAAGLAAAFASRRLSPVAAAEACLARIRALDNRLNAFCLVDEKTSLDQARASEKRWREGAALSAIDGVPVAIKDLLLTKDWPTRRGSHTIDPNATVGADAPSVARLREAGAVLIGKTTSPEFGWKGVTDSPLCGVSRNPWDPSKTPGGSSGGSAAAVAARFCPLALGTDGGGSIRIPASFSGCYGLKPSFGRVPAYPLSPFGTLAHVGPMSRTVRDSALLLNVISGPDARDAFAFAHAPHDFAVRLDAGVRGRRIAFSPRMGSDTHIDAEVAAQVAEAARTFERLGAHVVEADPPFSDRTETFLTLWWAGAGFLIRDMDEEKRALLDPEFRTVAEQGERTPLKQYLAAVADRGAYASAMRQFMENHDLILLPTMPIPAFAAGQTWPLQDGKPWLAWSPFTPPFNLTGQPAASIPCGRTRAGLPIGLQIAGGWADDEGVLIASAAFEAAHPFTDIPEGFA
jgi:aspartyl-tRNA(Asn)/glutamyl-tRNA(Gln) amidotransferase subunit A